MGKPNYFASGSIDRSGNLRRDPDWLADRLADPRTRILPLHGSDVALVGGDLLWLEIGDLPSGQALGHDREGVVFLGVDGEGAAVFGIDLSAPELAELNLVLPGDSSRMDLRGAAMLLVDRGIAGAELPLPCRALCLTALRAPGNVPVSTARSVRCTG